MTTRQEWEQALAFVQQEPEWVARVLAVPRSEAAMRMVGFMGLGLPVAEAFAMAFRSMGLAPDE